MPITAFEHDEHHDAHCIIAGAPRNTVGESPFWHPQESAVYWVDIVAGQIHRYHPTSGRFSQWQLPEQVGCIALTARGSIIAACETSVLELWLHDDGSLHSQPLANLTHALSNMRFNDGRCDRQGRLWLSTLLMDNTGDLPVGKIYRFTRQHGLQASPLADLVGGLIVPNGMAFSPDGRRMYLSDSHHSSRKIWALDYDVETGTPSNPRIFADLHQHIGRPDGAAVDTQGGYWICANDGASLLRFRADGDLDYRVQIPMGKPTMLAFGGGDLNQLYICSLHRGDDDIANDPNAGRLASISCNYTGLLEPLLAD